MGSHVFRDAALAPLPVAVARVAMGCCSGRWPSSSRIRPCTCFAHASWAEVAMLAGAVQLGLRAPSKITSPWWTLTIKHGDARSAAPPSPHIHEQTRRSIPAPRSSTTRSGEHHHVAAVFPFLQTFAAAPHKFGCRVRDASVGRAGGDAVLRQGRGADLRSPLPLRRRSVRRLGLVAVVALRFRCRAGATPRSPPRSRRPSPGSNIATEGRRAALRPGGDDHTTRDRGLHLLRSQGPRPGVRRLGRSRGSDGAHRPGTRPGVHGALAGDVV